MFFNTKGTKANEAHEENFVFWYKPSLTSLIFVTFVLNSLFLTVGSSSRKE